MKLKYFLCVIIMQTALAASSTTFDGANITIGTCNSCFKKIVDGYTTAAYQNCL